MKIMIDPGHGGTDPGACGNGIKEKDINLTLATGLHNYLTNNYDCIVTLTRDTDISLSLKERTDMANKANVDFFISLHSNGASSKEANGYEEFVYPGVKQKTKDIRDRFHPVVSAVWKRYGRIDRGKKEENFHVLRETKMSAILVENGFISNAEDVQLLKDSYFRQELVAAMAKGIADALELVEKVPLFNGTFIEGHSLSSVSQMQQWAKKRGAHQRFIDIAGIYWEMYLDFHQILGTTIRPEVLYAQAAKETNFGKYTGQVKPEQNNWAGIKIGKPSGDKPEDHESFNNPLAGVRAHFNHIAAYIGAYPLGTAHDRYYVVRSLSWAGTVRFVEELGGKWAPNPKYGEDIVNLYLNDLLNTEVKTEPKDPQESKEQQFIELTKAIEDWLCKYEDPHTIVVIQQGMARLYQERMGIPFPIRD